VILSFTQFLYYKFFTNHFIYIYIILDKKRVMQIFVRTLDDRTLTLDVQPEDTINEIKEIVEQREGNEYQRIL